MIETEFLFRARVTLDPPRELGDTPLGRRRIIGITGGIFSGPRLSGKVLPGGADWQIIRADGVAFLDARYTLEMARSFTSATAATGTARARCSSAWRAARTWTRRC